MIQHFRALTVLSAMLLLAISRSASAEPQSDARSVALGVGDVQRLTSGRATGWESSDPQIAQAYPGGFVVGLNVGTAMVRGASDGDGEYTVTVKQIDPPLVDPATLRQYPDSRRFDVDGRKCYGSELNGQRASTPDERRNTVSNRVINPTPLRRDRRLEWALQEGAEIYDGAGVLMGTVVPQLAVGDHNVPTSKFNFGMSKVLNGRLCLYAFSVPIQPTDELRKLIDPKELKGGAVGTSAWLPLDRVVDQARLLERVGLGKVKLPRLPLEEKSYRITGGDPNLYMTEFGEMSIVKDITAGPVPSHYLRRPSGTVNIIYSVPGFGLGGQGLDSFLTSDGELFHPAKGAKVFVQPTYFPSKHPQAGKASPKTMTFLYGAVEAKGCAPVYGWVAKEALEPAE